MSTRIVYIDESQGFGGAVSVLSNVLPLLEPLGFEAEVVLACSDARAQQAMSTKSIKMHVLPYRRRARAVSERLQRLNRRSRWVKRAYLLLVLVGELVEKGRWLIRLNQRLRRIRPDIVHANNGPQYNAAALLLARAMGFRTVVSVRGPDGRTFLAHLAEKSCDAEVFVSEHLRRSMNSKSKRALVIYDGLDMHAWSAHQAASSRDGRISVGHLGMFTRWKGQEVFLKAAALVAEKQPSVEFYLYGDVITAGQKEYAERLRAIAENSGHAQRIHFMGFQADVPRALGDLDILVHSSTSPEPFGMVVLEGMASGLAVIASDAGGPREIVRHGIDGLLVPPGDPEALADAIVELVQNPSNLISLGRAARQRVAECFTVQRASHQLATMYGELLRKPG